MYLIDSYKNVIMKLFILFLKIIYLILNCCSGWGYIVAFIKVLTGGFQDGD
jgi:hypothetical protein